MKIAAITNDGETISTRVGRAPYCLVFTVEDGEIIGKVLRDNAAFHQHHEHDVSHGHSSQSEERHARLVESLHDCDAILVREKLCGAYLALEQADIHPFVTEYENAAQAVQAYLDGKRRPYTEWVR